MTDTPETTLLGLLQRHSNIMAEDIKTEAFHLLEHSEWELSFETFAVTLIATQTQLSVQDHADINALIAQTEWASEGGIIDYDIASKLARWLAAHPAT